MASTIGTAFRWRRVRKAGMNEALVATVLTREIDFGTPVAFASFPPFPATVAVPVTTSRDRNIRRRGRCWFAARRSR
jgi:hypothetical protein